jgi:hypothetical protein
MSREPIRKSVRFEVFKRDSFACQYCGEKAPDVVLEVDHITPVSDGGTNEILNLVTACRACNLGKSNKKLCDSASLDKSRAQAEDLQERRNQLEMIAQWHLSLLDVESEGVLHLERLWFSSVMQHDASLTDEAKDELRKLVRRFGYEQVCRAVTSAASRFLRKAGASDSEARSAAFWSIGKICATDRAEAKDPGVSRLFYIRGILRNRCQLINDGTCIALLKEARAAGVSVDWMEELAKVSNSWTQFRAPVEEELDAIYSSIDEEATDGTHP